jgi:hypothetical protein
VAILPIFGVAHSLRINSDMLVVRALKIGQMIRQLPDGMPPTYDSMHWVSSRFGVLANAQTRVESLSAVDPEPRPLRSKKFFDDIWLLCTGMSYIPRTLNAES